MESALKADHGAYDHLMKDWQGEIGVDDLLARYEQGVFAIADARSSLAGYIPKQ